MVASLKFLLPFFVLGLGIKGLLCQECSPDNFIVGQVRTMRDIQGQAEWNVTVYNNGTCIRSNIVLRCQDFQTVEAVDPSIFSVRGDGYCRLINGEALKPFESVSFTYAFYPPFSVVPYQWFVQC